MPTARSYLGVVTGINDRIYAIAGWNGNDLDPLAIVEEFNPSTNTWQERTSKPSPGWGVAAVAASNGKIYVIGGGPTSQRLEAYDPTTDVWESLADMPTRRSYLGAAEINGKIYAMGGGWLGVPTAVVEAYDIASNQWTTAASMPTARGAEGVVAGCNQKIYVIGGSSGNLTAPGATNIVEEYNPATNTWRAVASMPTARSWFGAVLGKDCNIYAIGGETGSVDYKTVVERYDPATDTWAPETAMLSARSQLGAAVTSDGTIYAIGGLNWNVLSTVEATKPFIPRFSISGQAMDSSGNPISNVTLSLDNGESTSTNASGYYSFSGLPANTYILTPSKTGYSFTPASRQVTLGPDAIDQVFTASPQMYSISGQVTNMSNTPIEGVAVSDGAGNTVYTDGNGNYTLSGLTFGNYTITPNKPAYRFIPVSRTVTLNSDIQNVDFTEVTPPVGDQLILFDSDREGNWDIYTMLSDGSQVQRLTYYGGMDRQPFFSPDGRKIAFLRDEDEIRVMDALTGDPNNGSSQVIYDSHGDPLGFPRWSPDGKKIIFYKGGHAAQDIFQINSDGSGTLEQLTNWSGGDNSAEYSPDGMLIAWGSNGGNGTIEAAFQTIWTMSPDGSNKQQLKDSTGNPVYGSHIRWSPDGKELLVFRYTLSPSHWDMLVYTFDGSILTELEPAPPPGAWSMDSSQIAYVKEQQIWIRNRDGSGTPFQITNTASNEPFDWYRVNTITETPIAINSSRDGNHEVYVISPDGSYQRRLTFNDTYDVNPSISPDGKEIAFIRGWPWTQIRVMDALKGDPDNASSRLVYDSGGASIGNPRWSPDGQKIIFTQSNWEIFRVNSDGTGGLEQLTNHCGGDLSPDYFPGGYQIVFASNGDACTNDAHGHTIWIMNADGGNQHQLLNPFGTAIKGSHLKVSPDGSQILVFRWSDDPGENWDMYIVSADGSWERLLRKGLYGAWSPDGSQVVFSDHQQNIFVMNADGSGTPMQITSSPGDNEPWDWFPSKQSIFDTTPPVTTDNAPSGWQKADFTVTLTCTDDLSGCKETWFRLNGGEWKSGRSVSIQVEGQYVLEYYSIDVANNQEQTKTIQIQLDKTPPQMLDPVLPDGTWHKDNVTLIQEYEDTISGPPKIAIPLSTNVKPDDETDNAAASANGAQACDTAGNCAETPTDIPGNKIDRKVPQLVGCDGPDGAWHADNISLVCTYKDGGSGVVPPTVSLTTAVLADQETDNAAASANGAQACDLAGNCAESPADIPGNKIDRKAPTIWIDLPTTALLNAAVPASFGCTDRGSGVKSCLGTVSNGENIDTGSVGSKTFLVEALDNVNNFSNQHATYRVLYQFEGFLQPINDTAHQTCSGCPTSIFKGGSTVPVKFLLKDANGSIVQTTGLPIWLAPQMGTPTGQPIDEGVYTDPASTGNTYSWDGDQYHYNWSTKGYTTGFYWRIGVKLDDGQIYYVYIGLR